MKKLITIIGVAALVLAAVSLVPSASAQTPIYSSQALGLSGIVGGSSGYGTGGTNVLMGTNYTLASAPTIGALKQRYIALSETHSTLGTAGSTNTYLFAPSVDGVTYDTNAANCVTFVAKNTIGVGPVTTTTNWDTLGIGYYKLISVTTNSPATNTVLSYSIKIQSP